MKDITYIKLLTGKTSTKAVENLVLEWNRANSDDEIQMIVTDFESYVDELTANMQEARIRKARKKEASRE